MTHSPNLFPLKLLVVSLGLLLLGAIVFVLITIAVKAREEIHGGNCPDAQVHLDGKGTLTSLTPSGRTVQLTLHSAEGEKVLTVDRCTGALLQTFTVMP